MKLGAAWISGSVSLLSEALHSSLDILSAGVAFFTVRIAGKPADEDHPFGHGKIETISGLFESALLIVVGAYVLRESVLRLFDPKPVEHQGIGIAVMVIALIASYAVYHHNSRAARVAESSALQVNAIHYLFDVVSGLAVLVGLVLLNLTGWPLWDPIVGILVALYIAGMAITQVIGALRELADVSLPEGELREIQRIVSRFQASPEQLSEESDSSSPTSGRMLDAHDWRTRKSGPIRHIDFHMSVCRELTVRESHDLCDDIESAIEKRFSNASTTIHPEPCDLHSPDGRCHLHCARRQRAERSHPGRDVDQRPRR